jgi:hypothetical protein
LPTGLPIRRRIKSANPLSPDSRTPPQIFAA